MKELANIGNYIIDGTLGEGGMGTVFSGTDSTSGNRVAIKVVKASLAADNAIVKRFKQEIHISRSFAHPYVIKILDGGHIESENYLYLVMEFLDGSSLRTLTAREKLSGNQGQIIFRHMCEALSYIHKRKVVHRDIKGDNILIVSPQRTVLLDFGLALSDDLTRLSRTSDRPGTFYTMSPEQLQGKELDGRSDLYSLGVTMYRALTGFNPYQTDQIMAIATGTLPSPPHTIESANPTVSPFLSACIMRCIEIEKENRPPSADYILASFQKAAKSFPSSSKPSKSKTSKRERSKTSEKRSSKTTVPAQLREPQRSRSQHRRLKVLPLILICSLFAGTIYWFSIESHKTKERAISPDSLQHTGNTINHLAETIVKGDLSTNTKYLEKLGELLEKEHSGSGTEPIPVQERALTYLMVMSIDQKEWNTLYRLLTWKITHTGYFNTDREDLSPACFSSTVALEGNRWTKLLRFFNKAIENEEDARKKEDLLIGKALLLKSKADRSERFKLSNDSKKAMLMETLSICNQLLGKDAVERNIYSFGNLYLKTLTELDSEENRIAGIAFIEKYSEKPITQQSRLRLYTAGASLLTSNRAQGWESISKKDLVNALRYREIAFALAKKENAPDLLVYHIALAKIFSEMDLPERAFAHFQDIYTTYPDMNLNYEFVKAYGSALCREMKFDKAINLLENFLSATNPTKENTEKIEEINYQIVRYKEWKLLHSFNTKTHDR